MPPDVSATISAYAEESGPVKLASRIRRARKGAGLSQLGLAQLLGVQRSAVSNWESTKASHPALGHLIRIAEATHVSFEWLGTNRGQMRLDQESYQETPAIEAEIVDEEDERKLLLYYRSMPHRTQELILALCRQLRTTGQGASLNRRNNPELPSDSN